MPVVSRVAWSKLASEPLFQASHSKGHAGVVYSAGPKRHDPSTRPAGRGGRVGHRRSVTPEDRRRPPRGGPVSGETAGSRSRSTRTRRRGRRCSNRRARRGGRGRRSTRPSAVDSARGSNSSAPAVVHGWSDLRTTGSRRAPGAGDHAQSGPIQAHHGGSTETRAAAQGDDTLGRPTSALASPERARPRARVQLGGVTPVSTLVAGIRCSRAAFRAGRPGSPTAGHARPASRLSRRLRPGAGSSGRGRRAG